MSDGLNKFNFVTLTKKQTTKGIQWRLRLSRKIDPNNSYIPIGYDYLLAVNTASSVNSYLIKCHELENNPDMDEIKSIVYQFKNENVHTIQVITKDNLSTLWDKYVAFHTQTNSWSETYLKTHIQTVTSLIHQCPYQNIQEMNKVFQWFLSDSSRSVKTSKDRLKLVVACIEWCSISKLIERKYGLEYRDMLKQIKLPKKALQDEEINIFTEKELSKILNAFKTGYTSKFPEKIKQYYPYVRFLVLTGCRPSEAIALKWENVDFRLNRIKFCETEVLASGTLVKNKRTKTENYRYFPINEDLDNLLKELKKQHHDNLNCSNDINLNQSYVFIRKNGKAINQHVFKMVWERILKSLNIPYRVPYTLRHTFISFHVNNGENITKLAAICGNSPDVIIKHYLNLDVNQVNLKSRKL